jgi:hypothetical protein
MHAFSRVWLAGLALAAGSAAAAPPAADWSPVSAGVLDAARGGFTDSHGLAVSFGLERLVSLNGEVIARTSVQVPDISHLTAEQVRQTSEALSSVKLIQAGHDNIYTRSLPSPMSGATVVQNSLNDQAIRTQTVINASANSLALLQTLNFGRSLAEALAGSAGPH